MGENKINKKKKESSRREWWGPEGWGCWGLGSVSDRGRRAVKIKERR